MSNTTRSRETTESPIWIRSLGGVLIGLIGAAFAFALYIALQNFHRIGV